MFWRPEVKGQVPTEFGFRRGLALPGLQTMLLTVCSHGLSFVFYSGVGRSGGPVSAVGSLIRTLMLLEKGLILTILFNLNRLLIGPIVMKSHPGSWSFNLT